MCEYLGVSSGVYSQWNTGRTNPRKSKMPVIAEYLGVNVEDIQGDDEPKKESPASVTADGVDELDREALDIIHQLPPEKQAAALAMLRGLLSN